MIGVMFKTLSLNGEGETAKLEVTFNPSPSLHPDPSPSPNPSPNPNQVTLNKAFEQRSGRCAASSK